MVWVCSYQSLQARSCCCRWHFRRGVGSVTCVKHICDAAYRSANSRWLRLATLLKNLEMHRERSNYLKMKGKMEEAQKGDKGRLCLNGCLAFTKPL